VLAAPGRQKEDHKIWTEKRVADLHAKLPTNIMTEEDLRVVLKICMQSRNWQDLLISMLTSSKTTFLRADSLRTMTLADLCLNDTDGPKMPVWTEAKTLIQGRLLHKCKDEKKRVVGGFRHRHWMQCFTGVWAMSLMVRLFFEQGHQLQRRQGQGHHS
jgi:hypothetical protein